MRLQKISLSMRLLITAGPTREKIDPVRFISNHSSGRMGYSIAQAAQEKGLQVTLISGPVTIPAPEGVEVIRVTTAAEMAVKAVELLVEGKSNLVMCELDGEIKPVDIAFALIVDRMYKNKLKPGDLDRFTPEQIEAMKALTAKRVAEVQRLYKVASDVSF